MTGRLTITAPPAQEPVTLQEAKLYMKIDHDAEDSVIALIIAAARDAVERHVQLALITRSASLFLDTWPQRETTPWWDGTREGVASHNISGIDLPLPPLQAVTEIRLHGTDSHETVETAQYYTDHAGMPGRIIFRTDSALPEPARAASGIEIMFDAGYGDQPENIPPAIRQAVLKLAAYLYSHRGDDAASAIAASGAEILLQPYRRMRLA